MGSLSVLPVPAFDDNYLWLIHDGEKAVVVDPGDAAPIVAALSARKLSLAAILLTHHHADHIGGVGELLARYRVPVYGPISENIPVVTSPLKEGDLVQIPELELEFSVLDVPGHTSGHIAYLASGYPWLFCGDTLFAGGCGRLFEGTPKQMLNSLNKLAILPDETQVYCAHEYTLANLRFALTVEPNNISLQKRFTIEQGKRDAGQATVPSTIGMEKATNPFLRSGNATIVASLRQNGRLKDESAVGKFAALREWKNVFRN